MSANAKLVLADVSKDYPAAPGVEPLHVLRNISLTMAPGDRLAVVGPSGSGKSTLLNIIGTLDAPTGGSVRLGDVDPFALPPAALARFRADRVGFIFQDHHLLPQCAAVENVLLARLAAGPVARADVERAGELLAAVGLADRAGHRPGQLSGGERQRVAVARALINRPAVLLCDEPTGNLDEAAAAAVGKLILDLAGESGAIVIVATHSDSLANRVGRRARLSEGRLVG